MTEQQMMNAVRVFFLNAQCTYYACNKVAERWEVWDATVGSIGFGRTRKAAKSNACDSICEVVDRFQRERGEE